MNDIAMLENEKRTKLAMDGPRFKIGDRICWRVQNLRGVVESIINIDDLEDIKLQGYRYQVLLRGDGGFSRSVLEINLLRDVKELKNGNSKS